MIKEKIYTKENIKMSPFIVSDIAGILEHIGDDINIIELSYEYNKDLNKELDSYFAINKSDNVVFCIAAYISSKEFPKETYYLYENEEENKENKKELPVSIVLKRDSDVLTEYGFVNINEFIGYEYKVAFIYPNTIGLKVIKEINKLMDKFRKENKND